MTDAAVAESGVDAAQDVQDAQGDAFEIDTADVSTEALDESAAEVAGDGEKPAEGDPEVWIDEEINEQAMGTGNPPADPASEVAELSKRQQAMMACSAKIREQLIELQDARSTLASISEERKEAKGAVEAAQASLNGLCRQLADIERGEWQESLFKGEGASEGAGDGEAEAGTEEGSSAPAATGEDPGKTTPVSELGMTELETERLEGFGCDTIADVEDMMREKPHWHRDIRGFGPTKVDKLTDRLMDWRKEHPIPVAD